jgi:hypothetical protein
VNSIALIRKEGEMNTQSWTSNGFVETVRANSIPLTLIGVGVAWLAASSTGLADRLAEDERVQAARRRVGEIADNIGIGGASGDAAGGQLLGPDGQPMGRTNSGRGNGWVHQAAGAARGAIDSVRDAGSAMLDRAGAAGDLANRAGSQITEQVSTDPWLIGIAGLVAGALFAVMLPPTRMEQEYVTGARDELWNRAAELGHDAAERVRELADTTIRGSRP